MCSFKNDGDTGSERPVSSYFIDKSGCKGAQNGRKDSIWPGSFRRRSQRGISCRCFKSTGRRGDEAVADCRNQCRGTGGRPVCFRAELFRSGRSCGAFGPQRKILSGSSVWSIGISYSKASFRTFRYSVRAFKGKPPSGVLLQPYGSERSGSGHPAFL